MITALAWTLGGPEIAVIFIIVLLLFGAKKIPELARGLGKSMGEFKKARTEFEDEIKRAQDEAEMEEDKEDKDEEDKEKKAKEPKGKESTDE